MRAIILGVFLRIKGGIMLRWAFFDIRGRVFTRKNIKERKKCRFGEIRIARENLGNFFERLLRTERAKSEKRSSRKHET
jgi:hypothetical protein